MEQRLNPIICPRVLIRVELIFGLEFTQVRMVSPCTLSIASKLWSNQSLKRSQIFLWILWRNRIPRSSLQLLISIFSPYFEFQNFSGKYVYALEIWQRATKDLSNSQTRSHNLFHVPLYVNLFISSYSFLHIVFPFRTFIVVSLFKFDSSTF